MNADQKRVRLEEFRSALLQVGSVVDPEEHDPPIDRGIVETLVVLNAMGFNTMMSCEGHLWNPDGTPWSNGYNFGPYVELGPGDFRVEMSEEEMDALERRYMNDELTEEDHARSDAKELEMRQMHRRLIGLLEEFYASRSVLERYRLIASRLERDHHGFSFASQGAWAEYADNERPEFLKNSQAEMAAFTEFLREKYFAN